MGNAGPQADPMLLTTFLESNPDVEFISHQWLDPGNVLRTQVMPVQYTLSHADKPMRASGFALDLLSLDDLAPSFLGKGTGVQVPDWNRYTTFHLAL